MVGYDNVVGGDALVMMMPGGGCLMVSNSNDV